MFIIALLGFDLTWDAASWLVLLSTREELGLILVLGAVTGVAWKGLCLKRILCR